MTITDTKKCPKCGEDYPIDEYRSKGRTGTTTYSYCSNCRKEAFKESYQKNKLKANEMPWYNWWPLKQQNAY